MQNKYILDVKSKTAVISTYNNKGLVTFRILYGVVYNTH